MIVYHGYGLFKSYESKRGSGRERYETESDRVTLIHNTEKGIHIGREEEEKRNRGMLSFTLEAGNYVDCRYSRSVYYTKYVVEKDSSHRYKYYSLCYGLHFQHF